MACVPVSTSVCAVDIPGFGVPGPSGKFPPGDYALYRCVVCCAVVRFALCVCAAAEVAWGKGSLVPLWRLAVGLLLLLLSLRQRKRRVLRSLQRCVSA